MDVCVCVLYLPVPRSGPRSLRCWLAPAPQPRRTWSSPTPGGPSSHPRVGGGMVGGGGGRGLGEGGGVGMGLGAGGKPFSASLESDPNWEFCTRCWSPNGLFQVSFLQKRVVWTSGGLRGENPRSPTTAKGLNPQTNLKQLRGTGWKDPGSQNVWLYIWLLQKA